MTTIDPKILSKIKKCLALSSSPNPHEAAVAMNQAKALMRKHGVDAHHVTMSEIGESQTNSRTMSRDKPANWEAYLITTIGKAFGCKTIFGKQFCTTGNRRYLNQGQFIFIGQKAQTEIAAYTAEVLSRKCKSARQKWIAENSGSFNSAVGSRAKATRMGDAFAEGWVSSIAQLVSDFVNPPEIDEAINKHIQEVATIKKAETRKINRNDIGRDEITALEMGKRAAKGESIYRPMQTSESQKLISV